jgi:hypothetical protein
MKQTDHWFQVINIYFSADVIHLNVNMLFFME